MSQVLSQKEAVRNALTKVLIEAGIKFDEGSNFKELMTKELRSQVNQILFEGFRSGVIAIKGEKTDKQLKDYVSGLQSNWLNKDTAITGGVAYVTKNPGSRVGGTDPQVKALRALIKMATTSAEIAELQSYVDARLNTIEAAKPVKAKQVTVDFDSLPAELQAKYSTQA